jgi:spermidine synthase
MPENEAGTSIPAKQGREAGSPGNSVWTLYLTWLLLGGGGALAFSSLTGLLAPVLGATHAARGAAVGGIVAAAGAGLLFRRGSRSAPAPFLMASALYLLVAPWLFPVLEAPAGAILGLGRSAPLLLHLLRLVMAFLFAAVPCGALGAAFDALSREQGWGGADRTSQALRAAVIAAGASLGTVQAGFRLLPWGGEGAAAGAGAIALFAAAVLTGISRIKEGAPDVAPAGAVDSSASSGIFESGAFVWGAAVAAALPAWDRILSLVFGPYPESMSRTAGMFLAGCALGSLLVALFRGGAGGGKGRTLGTALLSALAGVAVGLSPFVVDRLPLAYLSMAPLAFSAPFSFFVKSWGVPALLVLPAGIAFGAWLPWMAGRTGDPAGGADRADCSSRPFVKILAGACLGSMVFPVYVIPFSGFRSALAAASVLILAASAATFAFSRGVSRILRAAAIAALLAATLFLTLRELPGNPRLIASGVHRYAREILEGYKNDLAAYRTARLGTSLSFYREGGESTVGVERVEADVSPILALTEEGAVTGTTYLDLIPQILSAQIPMTMRPAARDVLVIGYGTGIGAGSILLHPLARLDLVEPERAVVQASRQFEPANRIPRSDPRVRQLAEDPRLVLRWSGAGSYDLIYCRETTPEEAASRFHFTSGFYRLAASRLRKGGLFGQVLPVPGLSPADLVSVAATARSVFADVVILQPYYQEMLLLASDAPIRFDLAAMQAAIESSDKIRSDLGRVGLASADAMAVRHRLSGKGLEAFTRPGRILSDRGAPLTWAGYRTGSRLTATDIQNAVDRYSTGLGKRIEGLREGKEGNEVLIRLARASLAMGDTMRAADLADALLSRGDATDGHEVLGDAHYRRRQQIDAVREWHKALDADPRNVDALRSLADFSFDRGNHQEAEEYLRTALAARPGDPDLLFYHARALFNLKRYGEAESEMAKVLAVKGEQQSPLALYYLGMIQQEKKNLTGAAEFFRRYLQWAYAQGRLTPVEAEVHLALADIYKGLSLADLAEQQRKAAEVLQQKLKETARRKEKATIEWLKKP